MVKICLIAERSSIWMPFEYRTIIQMGVWVLVYHLDNGHLNTRQVKVCCSCFHYVFRCMLFRCVMFRLCLHSDLFVFQYDRTISETQEAYMKILESSRALLSVVKQEAQELPNVNNHQQRWVSIFVFNNVTSLLAMTSTTTMFPRGSETLKRQ